MRGKNNLFTPRIFIGLTVALLLGIVSVPIVAGVETESNAQITADISDVGLKIESFTITPESAYLNQDVSFTITLKDIGGNPLTVESTSTLEIIKGGTVVDTLNYPQQVLPPGTTIDITKVWNTDNENTGTYTARATIQWSSGGKDYSPKTTERLFTITGPAPPPPPPPAVLSEAELKLVNVPLVTEVPQGESRAMDFKVKNLGDKSTSNLTVEMSGVPENWIAIDPSKLTIGGHETRTINVVYSVPENAKPRGYGVTLSITPENESLDIGASAVIILRVTPRDLKRTTVTRQVDINRDNNTTAVTLTVTNGSEFYDRVEVTEEIPKTLASTTSEIIFNPPPSEIIEPDPKVKWVFESMHPYEIRHIRYTVNRTLPDYEPYTTWPIEEIRGSHIVPEVIKILEIKSEHMAPNENGRISIMLRNDDTIPHDLAIRLSLPVLWNVLPDTSTVTLNPGETTTVIFYAQNPKAIEPATYMGELNIIYDGEEITKGVAITVMTPPSESKPTVPPETIIFLYITGGGIALAVIGLVIKRVRENKYWERQHRSGVRRTLREMKDEEREKNKKGMRKK